MGQGQASDRQQREGEEHRVREGQGPQRVEPERRQEMPGRQPRQGVAPEVIAVEPPVAAAMIVRQHAALVEGASGIPKHPAQRRHVLRLQLRGAVPGEGLQHQQVLAGVAVGPGGQDERGQDQEETGHRRQQDVTGQRSHRTYDSPLPRRDP